MRLKCAWGTAAAKADKSDGASDVDLREHLRKTEQTSLPQAELLQGCFDLLKDRGLLEEAYLRGSLGRGHADTHSDIDLFAVIQPEKKTKSTTPSTNSSPPKAASSSDAMTVWSKITAASVSCSSPKATPTTRKPINSISTWP